VSPAPASLDQASRITGRGLVISAIGVVALFGVYGLALGYTPIEARQGLAQKIFYLHVPAAWSALLSFSLVGLASILYLWLQDPRLDRFAAASAEVGVVFSAIMLTTGPIWAKPIWGTWWTWDARLTLTLFLFFLFVGYLALRAAIHEPGERARFSAVVGILGLLLVPFIHLSVYLFRTLHPQPIVLKPSAPSLPGEMLRTLLISMLVFTVLYLGFVTARYGLALAGELREEANDAG
jgi:heme exporter protein C